MKATIFLILLVLTLSLVAQENSGYNPNSIRPIHVSDIMYKKTVTRNIDLREKQNKSLFSVNREITRVIIDAVKEGRLKVYQSDSLDLGKVLTKEKFLENLKVPASGPELTEEEKKFMQQGANDNVFGGPVQVSSGPAYFEPNQLYQLTLVEDFIIDKQRSRAYWDIQCLAIVVTAELNQKVDLPAGWFKYKDLVEIFKKDPRAIWFNPENDQEHRNMADAFDLRLFSSYITKVSNPSNAYLTEIYSESAKQGLMASYWAANALMEYEHNLWEF
jgi:gliding motility associated protien GldN